MTPAEFRKIRKDADLSLSDLSNVIRVHTRTIRRYEDGSVPISGPVSKLMELIDDDDEYAALVYAEKLRREIFDEEKTT